MIYPGFIFTPDKVFRVVSEFSTNETNKYAFEDGKAYLNPDTKQIWVYKDTCPTDKNKYPYMWFENGTLRFSTPCKEIIKLFKEKEARVMETEKIIAETNADESNNEPIFDDTIINDLNASSERFHPVIYDKDDFLKKLIKNVLNMVCISLNKYKSRVKQKYMISNMKSALMSQTKMSTMYFNAWIEMLGLKMTVIIESDESAEDKIPEPIVYLSERDNVFKLSELDNYEELCTIMKNNK